MVQIVRVIDALPEGFAALRKEAEADGWRHMGRLAEAWADGPAMHLDGEALLAVFIQGELAGIGGLTVEPSEALPGAYRMRRFYIREAHRGRGVGRTLANALIQQGLALTPHLTVHAGRDSSARFWEAMGFVPDDRNGWSHRYSA